MKTNEIGKIIRTRRKQLKLTQQSVAFGSGVGIRFLSEIENGKESCEIGKVLQILDSLGLEIEINER